MGGLLFNLSQESRRTLLYQVGVVLKGNMEGVDHPKYYIIVGINQDEMCVCSVNINSNINQFIYKRPQLLRRQYQIKQEDYQFLVHDSYVNCVSPKLLPFNTLDSWEYLGTINDIDIENIKKEIVDSGILSEENMHLYNLI